MTRLSIIIWNAQSGASQKSVLVNVTHAIPPQDVQAAASMLSRVHPCFPNGSIHLAFIDPGVGSDRRPVLIDAAAHQFVGLDNGLFTLVLEQVAAARIRHLTNAAFSAPSQFDPHGRGIFAPVILTLC
ncbi:MAG: SAM-dependent chlorinase/fluorinase [Verrucomicrobia bacterium]|nr:SAM-dependent chlorinase/fluorinase [Verrucomicrobiota bacterium]